MAGDQPIAVKDAVHKLQLFLLEGIQNENQLFAAGSLMSRSDYEDVVTERTIANLCGYPLCSNSLPSERLRKGHYRISLKEHKVYDLHETYMYCSSGCVVNSRSFAGSLQEERCSVLNSERINGILRLFRESSLESNKILGKHGDLGLSELKIRENVEKKAGEVSMEDWIGPSNAIEGYVPQRDRNLKPKNIKNHKEGSKSSNSKMDSGKNFVIDEMDFVSTIITKDEYSISKSSKGLKDTTSHAKSKEPKEKASIGDQLSMLEKSSPPIQNDSESKLRESKGRRSRVIFKDEFSTAEVPSVPSQSGSELNGVKGKEEYHTENAAQLGPTKPKSSLKPSGGKKVIRSVTWADEKMDSADSRDFCKVRELEVKKEDPNGLGDIDVGDDDNALRFASAEACAVALSQAAEAIASGETDMTDAVSEAGIIILPHPRDMDEGESLKDADLLEPEPVPLKWPIKPGISHSDIFDSDDSWYDTPPEGFSLTLSPFATMWMALFAWITSSSIAYIYGRDESFHEEYLSVNGREYPKKIVLTDGRSSEIKQTLAGCLARALPGLVADLRLPIPVSNLEQGVGRLLDTMSFVDALPSFRMKQWQVIVLLFIDALSVCRIPALTPHMTSRRMLFPKVFDAARVSAEEYEVMKDLIIPLGRVPQFSAQSGG